MRCSLLLLFILTLCASGAAAPQARRTLLVRIDNVTPETLLSTGVVTIDDYNPQSLISLVRDTAMVLLTKAENELLRERGIRTTIVREDTSRIQLMRRAQYGPTMRLERPYHTYDAMVREIDSLEKLFPSLLRKVSIGSTVRNRPIVAVKISAGAGEESDRPALLFNGCHHSDEVLGAEICMGIIHELAGKYGIDPEVTRWVDRYQIYVVPVVNIDGHDIVTSGTDPRWGKNARDTNGDGVLTFSEGVNLNRTYDFNWAQGGSAEPANRRYRGPYPFSEPETRAIADFARQKRFLLSLTYHSQGEVVFYPWQWKGQTAPDDKLLTSIAMGLAGSIRTMRGDTSYRAERGAALVGQSYSWLYGVLGTFDFVVETGRGASIHPPYEVAGIVRENMNGVRFMLRRAEGPGAYIRVTDGSTGLPLDARVWFPAIETEEVHRRTAHARHGSLRRLLLPGKHTCIISKEGYGTVVLDDVAVGETGWTTRDVTLRKNRD